MLLFCVHFLCIFYQNFKSILISYMFMNLIIPYFNQFHISTKYMYCKIRFNYKRQIDVWIWGFDAVAYNKCLLLPNNTPVISI